jgi:hypothetical protein
MSNGFGRQYPKGRMSADDDGQTTIGVASDFRAKRIVLKFARPMNWIGLDLDASIGLINLLASHVSNTFGVEVAVQIGDQAPEDK